MTEAYPLRWPPGWPRHKGAQDSDSRFNGPTYRWDRVYRGLQEEIKRIGGTKIVVSTNQPLRNDGYPYAQQRNITDVGVAVYFMRNGRPMVMAQDRFWSIIGNMRSLTMAIEGLRQMERHGGATMMERAFDGFAALPPPEDCWSILGISRNPPYDVDETIVMEAFRAKAREAHEKGGDMHRIVHAKNQALEQISA
jgi:hypothetical protein